MYQLPTVLEKKVKQEQYAKWLQSQARRHCKRDRRDKRRNTEATIAKYKKAIHEAVEKCGGVDLYTGEELNWRLLMKWDNQEAKKGGSKYKKRFALLPSVDHDSGGRAKFRICAWRTNDAKNDLSYKDFVELCRKVVKRANSSL